MNREYKRVLTVQDISCFGQCSLTVALPIISACGVETCILPSAVLSTHTGGFTGFTFRDLTDDIPAIAAHWNKEGIKFDAIYTGYLGSQKQIDMVKGLFTTLGKEGFVKLVDPAMADNGKLYTGFDRDYARAMAELCAEADIVLPNITEACFMTGFEYAEEYGEEYVETLLQLLAAYGMNNVVLTGVSYEKDTTGVVVKCGDKVKYYKHRRVPTSSHGTGDVFASAFTGALMNGFDEYDSARIAADFTLECIERTVGDEDHKYGVKFELALPELIKMLGK
ncbi:MAG: pyridoxamine kinase [Clostridia bacterium]|nr:pyridoxamine kinase [Clostridia bacterium]